MKETQGHRESGKGPSQGLVAEVKPELGSPYVPADTLSARRGSVTGEGVCPPILISVAEADEILREFLLVVFPQVCRNVCLSWPLKTLDTLYLNLNLW